MAQHTHAADVVIAGLGPVGLMAALTLGRQGHRVVGLDRWPTPYRLPRAVTFDHEIARLLNSLGIDSDSDPAIDYHDDHYLWINAQGETLLEVDWLSKAVDGWRNRYWFSQPDLEDRLRMILATLPNVTLLYGREAHKLEQDGEGVTVRFREVEAFGRATKPKAGGDLGEVRARYALGADGANSFVRTSLGLQMTDLDFKYDWLVVDTWPHEMPSYKTAHYQVCDPERPTTVVPGGPGKRRWEFMVLPGEDPAELEKPSTVWRLLEPFGLTPENAVLERAVVWRFQARYLEKWNHGRVLLAGDAAHLMPPFAGEGMCAGLRDVFNLAWRLDLVLRALAGEQLLDQWSDERRVNAKWYIDFSVGLGQVICVTDPEQAANRDRRMITEHAQQSKTGPVSPHEALLGAGTWLTSDPLAGKPSVQSRVAYRGRTGRFDDSVTRGWVLLSHVDAADERLTEGQDRLLSEIGGCRVVVGAVGSGAEVIDADGGYLSWMAEHGVGHLLVRPDFYVAATARSQGELRDAFSAVMAPMASPALAGV